MMACGYPVSPLIYKINEWMNKETYKGAPDRSSQAPDRMLACGYPVSPLIDKWMYR